ISFNEALQHFQTADLSESRKRTGATARGRGLPPLLRCCLGPPRLRAALRGERDLALAMARCALDDNERVHMRILQTVYNKLTRSRLGCPRYGAHWEELGFQASGTVSLKLGVSVSRPGLSRGGSSARGNAGVAASRLLLFQGFPFCLVSLNVTRVVLQALREERLSRECNRRRQVLAVLNELYAAALLQLCRHWKGQHKTLDDTGSLLEGL
ncbi:ELMD3 protein, partial [Trogon melanurus]|nr:ELMD3 protein [Trogon melanurus]